MSEFLVQGLQVLGADLDRLNTTLALYEQKLQLNDKSTILKGLVEYYRQESHMVRACIVDMIKKGVPAPVEPLPVPVPVPTPVPPCPCPVPAPEPTPVPVPDPVPAPEPAPAPEPVPAPEVVDPFEPAPAGSAPTP